MRAVFDVNVLISALLSRTGAPAALLEEWLAGSFELILSDTLLSELERTLSRPKLRSRVDEESARRFLELLRALAELAADPVAPQQPVRSRDAADDYLVELAASEQATLVSGDVHLLELSSAIPVFSPREFLDRLR